VAVLQGVQVLLHLTWHPAISVGNVKVLGHKERQGKGVMEGQTVGVGVGVCGAVCLASATADDAAGVGEPHPPYPTPVPAEAVEACPWSRGAEWGRL
jgi:hypothetical protein